MQTTSVVSAPETVGAFVQEYFVPGKAPMYKRSSPIIPTT